MIKTSKKVLISPSSFGKCGDRPIELLKENNYELILNPYGRKLTSDEVIKLGKDSVGIIAGVEPLNKEVLSSLKDLYCISRVGSGIDNIDIDYANKNGIIVKSTPYGPTRAVAELTIGLIFDLLRKISFRDRSMRKGKWEKEMGHLLKDKKIGIIGLGKIGKKVAELLIPFDVKLYTYDIKPDMKYIKSKNITYLELKELLKKCDIICIHVNISKNSHPFIGKKEIDCMKKDSFLINVSRGGVVDEKALFDALQKKHFSGVAIDVFSEEPYNGPLTKFDNVVLTPHIGSYAKESRLDMEVEAVNNFIKAFKK